jgi:hypothetical protein
VNSSHHHWWTAVAFDYALLAAMAGFLIILGVRLI